MTYLRGFASRRLHLSGPNTLLEITAKIAKLWLFRLPLNSFEELTMKKLLSFTCLFLFVFALAKPCQAQDWSDYFDFKHLDVSWNWGNSDIPQPDFSQFPPRPTGDHSPSWQGLVIADGLDLSGRDLRNARIHLRGGTLRNVNFDGANLEGAVFCEVVLENPSFRGANLIYARIVPSPDWDMTDAILGGVAGFLTEEQMRSTWNFKNRDFSNTIFFNCDFPDVEYDSSFNFTNMSFGAPGNFFFCCMNNWQIGFWQPVFLQEIQRFQRNIKFEDFRWAQLPKIGYTAEQAFRTRDFRRKSLHGLTIENMDFTNADFSGFTIGTFINCNFQGANFEEIMRLSPQTTAIAIGWMTQGRYVRDVNNIDINTIRFGFVNCRNLTQEQMKQTHFWKSGDLRGLILERMNLDGWDFSNKDLSGVSLIESSVIGASFENAIIERTVLPASFTFEQLTQTSSWRNRRILRCTLVNIKFCNQDLSNINFSGTKFFNCSFENTRLTRAFMDYQCKCNGNRGLTEEQLRSLRNFHEDMLQLIR